MPQYSQEFPTRLSDWLKGEVDQPQFYCRANVTLLAGEDLRTGSPVGIVTASGKYAQFDPDAGDGTEDVKGILITDCSDPDTAIDREVVVLVRGPAVIIKEPLNWIDSMDAGDITTALAALKALGIVTEEGA